MPVSDIAQQLRAEAAAVRLSFTWLGARKTLSNEQKQTAADPFNAEGKAISASKQLLDTSHPKFRAVGAIRTQARDYWASVTLPYPESGIRLIRRNEVEAFHAKMEEFRESLHAAVQELENAYPEMKAQAQTRLGTLYRETDYPDRLDNLFSMEWDFPSVEPPEYLMTLNPALYEAERQRIAARFEVAISQAENAFAEELQKMVSHLAEKLTDGPDGKKVFRDSAITNLTEFFERFKNVSVRSNSQLDALVEQAKGLVAGVDVKELRGDDQLRATLATQMAAISQQIEENIVTAPKRKIGRIADMKTEEPIAESA
jgi:F0F1-type ATP synthase membrane subunit b/b'